MPSSSSILNKRLYLATLSDLAKDPVLICEEFVATATIYSEPFEDNTKYWNHSNEEEQFKDRIHIKPDFILDPKDYIDGKLIGPSLEYMKRWRPEKWHLSFFGMLHIIPQNDFRYLEKSIQSNTSKSFKNKKSKKIRRLSR